MPELMRLDRLIGFPNARTDTPDWIFQSNSINGRVQQPPHKVERFFCLLRSLWSALVPMQTTGAKESTRRVGNHQVPIMVKDGQDIALVVIAQWRLTGQNVARCGVMSCANKRIAYRAAIFASH
jgi:hypothetical protein